MYILVCVCVQLTFLICDLCVKLNGPKDHVIPTCLLVHILRNSQVFFSISYQTPFVYTIGTQWFSWSGGFLSEISISFFIFLSFIHHEGRRLQVGRENSKRGSLCIGGNGFHEGKNSRGARSSCLLGPLHAWIIMNLQHY